MTLLDDSDLIDAAVYGYTESAADAADEPGTQVFERHDRRPHRTPDDAPYKVAQRAAAQRQAFNRRTARIDRAALRQAVRADALAARQGDKRAAARFHSGWAMLNAAERYALTYGR